MVRLGLVWQGMAWQGKGREGRITAPLCNWRALGKESKSNGVVDPAHPITRGIASRQMADETYFMASVGDDSRVLLTTDRPDSMHVLGWTRQFRSSRVFCLQSGHDNLTYVVQNFRKVFRRGLQWCAG